MCAYVCISGSNIIAYVECYDADYNEWYDASPMNLNRSAVSACVISGLTNAREYSYLGKARDLGQGRCNIQTTRRFLSRISKEMIKPPTNIRSRLAFIHIYDIRNRTGTAFHKSLFPRKFSRRVQVCLIRLRSTLERLVSYRKNVT